MKKIWSDKAWDDYLYWQARSFERKPQRILEPANSSIFFLAKDITKMANKKIPSPNGLGIFCKSNIREN